MQDPSLEILGELVPYEDPKVQALEGRLREEGEALSHTCIPELRHACGAGKLDFNVVFREKTG